MAKSDVIANALDGADQVDAAWQAVGGPMIEAQALVELYQVADMESWSSLAIGTLERLLAGLQRYEHLMETSAIKGGMGAVAPMVTKVVDS
ncbi:hypothetical protein [Hydrogenophaga sp. ANAO-22]|uniref:hypothetical protein n=1 Tax=Hydrogenophaga sp. ANAO-22 TaxID=3166645 RepID=UPI0036D317B0